MKARRHSTGLKWFLVGFGVRASLAAIITLLVTRNVENALLHFADLPTVLMLTMVETFFRVLSFSR